MSPAVVKRSDMSVKVPISASPSLSSSSEVLRAIMTAASRASLPRCVRVIVFMSFSISSRFVVDTSIARVYT